MIGFLKRLFGNARGKRLVINGFSCETCIKLPTKVPTPLGGKVTIINVCVDIHYSIDGNNIVLHRVRLSRRGTSIMGSSMAFNVASTRTGEAWFTTRICPESSLAEAAQQDLLLKDSRLRRVMVGKWRALNRNVLVGSLVDALNSQAPPDQIERLISTAGRGKEITFTYTKPRDLPDSRHVSVLGVSGNSIRARDHKDDQVKNFRIDRISNARSA